MLLQPLKLLGHFFGHALLGSQQAGKLRLKGRFGKLHLRPWPRAGCCSELRSNIQTQKVRLGLEWASKSSIRDRSGSSACRMLQHPRVRLGILGPTGTCFEIHLKSPTTANPDQQRLHLLQFDLGLIQLLLIAQGFWTHCHGCSKEADQRMKKVNHKLVTMKRTQKKQFKIYHASAIVGLLTLGPTLWMRSQLPLAGSNWYPKSLRLLGGTPCIHWRN